MSAGGGSYGRTERVRQLPHYDQVPGCPPQRARLNGLHPLKQQQAADLALSSNPLPPPPLPDHPAVGPESDRSGSEGNLDPDNDVQHNLALNIKPIHRFIPDSWKSFFRGTSDRSTSKPWPVADSSFNNSTSDGVRCSPPHSPSLPGSHRDPYGGSGSSYNSRKELLGAGPLPESLLGQGQCTALTYTERLEEYNQRYDYMKSWAGLLRILGCVELLLGAAVFACVCAFVHKDNEWFKMFGYSSPGGAYGGYGGGMYGGGTGGAYYSGPQTPFVLVVTGLAWVVTVILLVLGMTMYYRTILLDSSWWPPTEFILNLALALIYMVAGILYVRDTTRGGLCYYPVFNNGINGAVCHTEAGQTAAIIFLFVTMLVYLIGAIVCLKLWRHEVSHRYREMYAQEMHAAESHVARSAAINAPGPRVTEQAQGSTVVPTQAATNARPAKVVLGDVPSGHIPKPVILPDFIVKYPTIRSDDERGQYQAVFHDQYAEYKELHSDVQAAQKKFEEMDVMMHNLPQHPNNQTEYERINRILQEYKRKRNDPTFLEKRERCEYLKSKLSHIKQKIHEYDKIMKWNDGFD